MGESEAACPNVPYVAPFSFLKLRKIIFPIPKSNHCKFTKKNEKN